MAKRRRGRGGYRISHGGQYRMTPKRRAALRKAQLVSARKRKGLSTRTKVGIGVGVTGTVAVGAVLGAGVVRHKLSGSELDITVGRGRPGHMVPERGPGGHGPKTHHIQRGSRRIDPLSVSHRTVQRQNPSHPHIKAAGVQITPSGKETPWHEEHVFGVSIPFLGHVGGRYRHKGVSGRTLKKALTSPTHVQNVLFGRKVISGGRPPQAGGLGPPRPPHTPGRRITQAQRDAVPHNRPGTKSQKGPVWPGQVSAKSAKEQNVGLREGTHYLHPVRGVVPYPSTARGKAMVRNKQLKWMVGQDRNVLPRDWYG